MILLETARRALSVNQRALDTVGHNMANASTPGYSRQEVILTASEPTKAGVGLLVGTGVKLADIRRHFDAFLDAQLRAHSSQLAFNLSMQDALQQVEIFLGEPSEAGVMSSLERFWVALNDLAQHPESMATRALVRESAGTAATIISRAALDLRALRQDIEETLRARVAEVNGLAKEIAEFNYQITSSRARGHSTNDLEDKRDLLVDRLAELTGARATVGPQGDVRVSLSGIALVDSHASHPISLARDTGGDLRVAREGMEAFLQLGGAMGGLLRADQDLAGRTLRALDTLAAGIVDGFNRVHAAGYGLDGSTGTAFFVMAGGAATLRLSDVVMDGETGLRAIAAASTPVTGDSENARRLAGLKENLPVGGFTGWDEYWRNVVAGVGVTGAEVNRSAMVGRLLVKEIENRRDSVRGVSLDEEVTNLVRFQHAYAAAARLATAADELLDVIINRLGLVGR
ncbi:MAG: flagellar hook-associated protein FlgK [Bacillota bacterium]